MPITWRVRRLLPFVLLGVALAFALHERPRALARVRGDVAGARYRADPAEARRVGARPLTPQIVAATLRFDPSIPAGDQAAVRAAVSHARPEARELIELVDGEVQVRVGDPGGGAVGTAETGPAGWTVTLDLAAVWPRYGQRGVDRLVLHELGHVVDAALVDDALLTSLDAGIPRGWGCDEGRSGACAAPEERFAESFMKWATDDIGVDVWLGYKVPPPGPTLDAWGAPLARLGAPAR